MRDSRKTAERLEQLERHSQRKSIETPGRLGDTLVEDFTDRPLETSVVHDTPPPEDLSTVF